MRTLLLLAPLAAVILGQCPSAAEGGRALAWRGCWEWSMPKDPEDMATLPPVSVWGSMS